MFFRYLRRELRRRIRSASVVAIGLALGVGLVITVTAAAAGVNAAQGEVLEGLYGVGTDLTVTQPPAAGSGGSFRFGGPGSGFTPGQTVSQDSLRSVDGLGTLASSKVTSISGLPDVAGATGVLALNSVHFSGTLPSFPGEGGASATATPTPTPTPTPSASPSPSSGSSSFNVSTFTVTGVDPADPGLGPLSEGNISSGASVVEKWFGEASQSSSQDQLLALVTSSYAKQNSLSAGSTLSISGTNFDILGVISLSSSDAADVYIPLSEAQTLASDSSDVNEIYVTADNSSQISTVQSEIQKLMPSATVTTASDVASEVTGSLSTASTLAKSLGLWIAGAVLLAAFVVAILLTISSVTRRVREFGTLKAIGWRSRRIVGQVIGETAVLGVIGGVIGVGLGALGAFLVTLALPTLSATVGATGLDSSSPSAGGGPGGGGFGFSGFGGGGSFGNFTPNPDRTPGAFARTFTAPTHTVSVHTTAPLNLEILVVAVALAIVGGILAGVVGGWRAARMRPADALRRVE